MGCCSNKPDVISMPEILNIVPKENDKCTISSSFVSTIHPSRLVKFDDESLEDRLLIQVVAGMNRNMNSPLQISEQESCRRPDPRILALLTSSIIDEVEQGLITDLTTGSHSMAVNSSACFSFKAISFKNSAMQRSQLGPAIIEAALTHIIDHLGEYPKVVAALGRAKIGYHDKGMMLEDAGVRLFVIKGFSEGNAV